MNKRIRVLLGIAALSWGICAYLIYRIEDYLSLPVGVVILLAVMIGVLAIFGGHSNG